MQEIAQALFATAFEQLAGDKQDEVLGALAGGNPPGVTWQTLPADRFFEELLAELTETYYAHPWAQDEIGYVGYANMPTWTRIGLNEKEPREA
ncbi:gluconate 2-dehydrogenase subunit 3 family protein [Hymenobacter sp. BRD67]|uniref:gluconate 2-dehydrogenase subunit 3 family protein n=1 Tax=Hymenobacter sp. BRD67 TaxID=2675877 RepID=UPI0020B8E90D|nr:gluconate 2-dehydrogenase subunit 3 family protein [Hymenobacter sp. BRD67]